MRLAAHASFRRTVIAQGLLAALTVVPGAGAWAQLADTSLGAAADVAPTASSGAGQQGSGDGTTKRAFSFVPRLSLQQTFSSNIELRQGGRADQMTEVSPGFRFSADGSRLKAYVDYSLRGIAYGQRTDKSAVENALTAYGNLRLIDNWAFVDFNSSISQQAISAFGAQLPDNGPANNNLAETRVVRVSPYLVGRLGGFANYEARYTWATSRSEAGTLGNNTTNDGRLTLRGDTTASRVVWNASLSSQRYAYSDGRTTNNEALRAVLGYAITPQLNLSLIAGRETNNYASLSDETHNSGGWSLNWNPSERTQLAVSRENRFFGEAHSVSLAYRGRRTELRFSDTRDVSANPNQGSGTSAGSIYDLLFSQMASLEPDPIKRADLVNAFLQAYGLGPNSKPTGGFLTSAVSLNRAQNLSFAILGVRDTITFVATQSQTRRLDSLATGNDDLANGATVHQQGFSASYAHRLTPMSSFSVLASHSGSSGSTTTTDTNTRSLNLNFTTRVGSQSTATLGARRVLAEGGTQPYTESALIGSLNMQF